MLKECVKFTSLISVMDLVMLVGQKENLDKEKKNIFETEKDYSILSTNILLNRLRNKELEI